MLKFPIPQVASSTQPQTTWIGTFFYIVLSVFIAFCLFASNVLTLVPALLVGCFAITMGLFLSQTTRAQSDQHKSNTKVDVNQTDSNPILNSPKLRELIKQQQNTYHQVFLKNPTTFHQPSFHYDWWMFPVPAHPAASATSKQYAVNNAEIAQLLENDLFMKTYLSSVDKYINNLSAYGWNNYPIRFEKMLNSLFCFLFVSQNLVLNNNQKATQKTLHKLSTRAVDYAQKNNITANRMAPLLKKVKALLATIVVSTSQKQFMPAFKNVSFGRSDSDSVASSFMRNEKKYNRFKKF